MTGHNTPSGWDLLARAFTIKSAAGYAAATFALTFILMLLVPTSPARAAQVGVAAILVLAAVLIVGAFGASILTKRLAPRL